MLGWLLFFTDQRTTLVILVAALGLAAYRRRWLLLAVVAVSPVAAVWLSRLFKEWFGRTKDEAVAYPSGHTTLMVVVLGMALLVVGARLYAVVVAVVWVLLGGMLGQAVTYHYITDAVGGLLLGSAIVCVAALMTQSTSLTRR